MPRNSVDALVEDRLDETAGGRFLDLRCDMVVKTTNEVIWTSGGVWDRDEKAFAGPAERSKIMRLVASQIPAARWFALWMAARAAGRHLYTAEGLPIFVMVCIGGRRGGKSNFSHKAILAYAVHNPRSVVWFLVARMKVLDEVVRDMEQELGGAWIASEFSDPWFRELANGSEIHIKSSWDLSALKEGRVDVIVIVEAQLHDERVLAKVAPAVADKGGLVILTSNPPDTAAGEWVDELCDSIEMGTAPAIQFDFDATLNPEIDQEIVSALSHILSDEDYEREMKGNRRVQRRDVVMHAFSKPVNVHPSGMFPLAGGGYAELEDITPAITKRFLGQAFKRVHGLDFQLQPQASATIQFYRDPADPNGFLVWYVDCVTEVGNEDALIDELERAGYSGEDAIVPDATGEWQNAERTKGKGSVEAFRKRGWKHVYLPDPHSRSNPPVSERLAIFNGGLRSKSGRVRIYVDPSCAELIRALRLWPASNGRPKPGSEFAHVCDASSYPLCRFFPRRPDPGKFVFTKIDRAPRANIWGETR